MTLDSGLSTLDTRLGGGDRRAFERLYESYAAMVHGILLARIPRIDVVGMPLLQKEGTLRSFWRRLWFRLARA